MGKLKVAVIFGGKSTEHEVSRLSASSVLMNIDKEKYEIYPIGIDKQGNWLEYTGEYSNVMEGDWQEETTEIKDLVGYLKNMDVVFPILHGLYGEDGTIQGLLELIGVSYVGCKVLASSVSMDKIYTKVVFEKANIPQLPYVYIKKDKKGNFILINHDFTEVIGIENCINNIEKNIGFPCFIKPSNSGSSVGINKAKNIEELKEAIKYASEFDSKIIIEQGIDCREIECAILGDSNPEASILGEILPAGEFYSYDSKYNDETSGLCIPAKISKKEEEYIREMAIKAFKSVDGSGLSRVDFFIDKKTNDIYINEINTMPGFTTISMYPKLWENTGLTFGKLIDKLINLALE